MMFEKALTLSRKRMELDLLHRPDPGSCNFSSNEFEKLWLAFWLIVIQRLLGMNLFGFWFQFNELHSLTKLKSPKRMW